jgi:heme/copper-type cytochrome/quinol oxidase subunit 2
MLALLYQSSSFLQMFVDSCDEEGCEDTALNWVIAAVVVAVVCALLMLAFKWLRKYTAINIVQKAWSRGQTIVLVILGLIPVLLVLLTIWYITRNFHNYVGVGGLLKGVLMSWLLYVLFMFAGHVLSPWRREIL